MTESQERTGTHSEQRNCFSGASVLVDSERERLVAGSAHKKMVAHNVLPFFIFLYAKRSSTFFCSKGIALAPIEQSALFHSKSKLPYDDESKSASCCTFLKLRCINNQIP